MTEMIAQGELVERANDKLAKKMRVWAIVALVLGIIASIGLPNSMLVFGDHMQEAWQFFRFIGWGAVQFGLPLSAALFVGAVIVRRLPDRSSVE